MDEDATARAEAIIDLEIALNDLADEYGSARYRAVERQLAVARGENVSPLPAQPRTGWSKAAKRRAGRRYY